MPIHQYPKILAYTILQCLLGLHLYSQSIQLFPDDFYMTGDAVRTGGQCFQLTEDDYWQSGAVWFKKSIDLKEPFEMELNISFGCRDELGADGIVFIFYPGLTTGRAGEGMGFGGLFPSFGVEMDTYQNFHLLDPFFDHVALVTNGSLHHQYGLTDPVKMKRGINNLEDCVDHLVRFQWLPLQQIVRFYFDDELRIEKKIDLIQEIFGGNSSVYWGFTSATGDKTNRQAICIRKIEFTENFSLEPSDRQLLLDGGRYILKNVKFPSGSTRLPENAKPELDKLIPFFNDYPTHSIMLGGFTDSSGDAEQNKRISQLRAKAVADYLKQNGVASNRVLYRGYGEDNPIESNTTEMGRLKNRRVEVMFKILKV